MGPGRGRGPYERQPFHAEDGSFVLEDVPAGRWMVEAFAPGFQAGSAAAVTVGEGDASDAVEVRLTKGGAVSGRVLESRTGRPILDATVRIEPSGGERRMGMMRMGGEGDDETSTDADGRYELTGLAPGSWVLTASHPEWSESTTSVEVKDAPASADVRLGRGGSIGGTVLGGARPVAGAQVTLSPAGESGMRMGGFMGGGEQSALTDEGGRFRFDRLNPGRYQLSAALRDQTSAPADAVLTGDDSQDVQLTLAAGALLKGVVSGLADNQLTGVTVSASGQDYFASARTGAGGVFELSGVPEGLITLRANAGDFLTSSRSASATVTIGPGQAEATAEIVFEAGFRVDGHVTRGGKPVPDAMVSAFPDGGNRRSANGRTDDGGGYVLEGLDAAKYTFTASSQSGGPIRRTVEVGGDTTVDLDAPPARLAGTVVEAESGTSARRRQRPHRGGARRRPLHEHGDDRQLRPLRLRGSRAQPLPCELPEGRLPGRDARAHRRRGQRRARRAEAGRGHRARGQGRHLRDAAARAVRARGRRRRQPGLLGQRLARQRRPRRGAVAQARRLRPARGIVRLRSGPACRASRSPQPRSTCCSRPAARSRSRPVRRRSRCRSRPAA
jgi:protocatechuate 3,4-dioxygenase beta subunit